MTRQHCGLRQSAGFLVCLVECLLDVAGPLLQLAFDLLGNALYLLRLIAGQFPNLSLKFAATSLAVPCT
jgi:hypothetical protein